MNSLRNKLYICLFLILLLLGCAKEPAQQNILKSMAELDRRYIPALLFSNLQKQRETEIAMERLVKEWKEFDRKYHNLEFKYGLDIKDKFWKEDFCVINALIATAEGFVKEGKLTEAHAQLGGVRMVLRELRHRNGLKYYLDGMNEFHEAMESIILGLRGKDNLTDKDLDVLRGLFKKAQAGWAKVGRSEIDPSLFDFDTAKIEAIRKRVKEEERVLASFAAALSSEDPDRIFQSAQDLKPNFVVLYKAFGDFQPIFDKVLEERKEVQNETRSK